MRSSLPGYDAWLEAAYQQQCEDEDRRIAAEDEADERASANLRDPIEAQSVIAEHLDLADNDILRLLGEVFSHAQLAVEATEGKAPDEEALVIAAIHELRNHLFCAERDTLLANINDRDAKDDRAAADDLARDLWEERQRADLDQKEPK